MYGLSDHSNIIPRTRFSALRQGSSRYSTCMSEILEHTFAEAVDTSAAARWKPSGAPAAANVSAISSISPTQRQPFARAERSAPWSRSSRARVATRATPASSVSSTPSARATSLIASSSAALPFVHAAYAGLQCGRVADLLRDYARIHLRARRTAPPIRRPSRAAEIECVGDVARGRPTIPPSTKRAKPPRDLTHGRRRDGIRLHVHALELAYRRGHVSRLRARQTAEDPRPLRRASSATLPRPSGRRRPPVRPSPRCAPPTPTARRSHAAAILRRSRRPFPPGGAGRRRLP